MSHYDSNTPAPEGSAGASAERSGLTQNVPLLVGLALLLVAGVIAFFVLGGEDDGAASDCVAEEVRLTTAPAMEELVKEGVKAFEAEESCLDVKLTVGTVSDVVALLNDPDAEMPELWVPDSPTWKGQLAAAGWAGTPIVDVVAQTPVGLAGGPVAKAPASWAEVLAGGKLSVADPSSNGASALALLAPYAESKQTGRTEQEIKDLTVPVAQSYGEAAGEDGTGAADLQAITASSTQLVPVTEQGYLAARRSNDQLTLVAPRTGVPMLQFPIIDVGRAGIDVNNTGRDVSARVGRGLAHWFSSGEGQAAVTAAEFRLPDAKALTGGVGLGASKVLPVVDQKTTDNTMREWRVLAVPSSILALVDLSGSMKQQIGNISRVQLATNAALLALDNLPANARIGTWGFSKNRGENNAAWEEFVPMRPLNEEVDGGLQRDLLASDSAKMASRVRGATAVLDATLAAYKTAQAEWDAAWFNSVVIFTDGASDDTSSMNIDALVKQLENLRDPSKPVKVVVIGISQDADTPELAQIAKATGGQNYLVTDPDDMLGVLASAMLNR